MKNYLLLAGVFLVACSSTPPKTVEPIQTAAQRNQGDLESGTYNNVEGENLLVVSQSLSSRITEMESKNRELDESIQEQKLRQKSLLAESNELNARKKQMESQARNLASQPKPKVIHKTTTVTTEESE